MTYRTRILIALPGHPPIELVRFNRSTSNADRKTWVRWLAPEWRVIEEHARPIPEHRETRP